MSSNRKPRIVVAEDDALLRLDARMTLEDAGFEVIEAEDGSSALDSVRTDEGIDIVFTDVQMPGPICGLELARRVHDLRPAMPVFIASGMAAAEEVRAAGCSAFFRKPYAMDHLVAEFRAVLA